MQDEGNVNVFNGVSTGPVEVEDAAPPMYETSSRGTGKAHALAISDLHTDVSRSESLWSFEFNLVQPTTCASISSSKDRQATSTCLHDLHAFICQAGAFKTP